MQTVKTNVRGLKREPHFEKVPPSIRVTIAETFKTNVRGAKARTTFGVTDPLDP